MEAVEAGRGEERRVAEADGEARRVHAEEGTRGEVHGESAPLGAAERAGLVARQPPAANRRARALGGDPRDAAVLLEGEYAQPQA